MFDASLMLRDLLASLASTGIPFPRNLKNALDGPPAPTDTPSSTGGVEGGRSYGPVSSLSMSLSEQSEGVGADVIDGVGFILGCMNLLGGSRDEDAVVLVLVIWGCFPGRMGREREEGIDVPAGRERDEVEPDAKLESADEIPEWRFEGPPKEITTD